ncbi:MAG: hypothetical protein AAGH19_00895 [Pseudomonadota bacterium]
MGSFFVNFLQLALLANAGVFLACKLVKYPIPDQRKAIAATAFALIYSLPLPIGPLIHLASPVALWMLLKDPEVDTKNRLPVFLLTYLFAAILTVLLFHMTQG